MPFSWAATARDTASELFPVPPFWVTNATTCMHGPSTTHVRVSYPKVNKLLHAASRKRQTASGLRRAVDGIRHTAYGFLIATEPWCDDARCSNDPQRDSCRLAHPQTSEAAS